jgi:hypothetical protein
MYIRGDERARLDARGQLGDHAGELRLTHTIKVRS